MSNTGLLAVVGEVNRSGARGKAEPAPRGSAPPALGGEMTAVRANALFASELQPSHVPSAEQVRQAVATAICAFTVRGCAARVAQEFGDHPETAAARMRWARMEVADVFGGPGAEVADREDIGSRIRAALR